MFASARKASYTDLQHTRRAHASHASYIHIYIYIYIYIYTTRALQLRWGQADLVGLGHLRKFLEKYPEAGGLAAWDFCTGLASVEW